MIKSVGSQEFTELFKRGLKGVRDAQRGRKFRKTGSF